MTKPKLLPVKPFQETLHANMCGAATLKMVLAYYGIDKTEQELAVLCGITDNLGVDDQGLKRVAESCGLKADIRNNSSFADIQKLLDKEIPIIVNWFTRGRNDYPDSEVADGHYSVVVGLDDEFIYIQDTEIGGMRKISKQDFMKVWFDFTDAYIKSWDEMIIRQIIAVYRQ